MRWAIIKNQTVVNIAACDNPIWATNQGWIEAPEWLMIGALYENGDFIPVILDESAESVGGA